jgi:hypothetical protein
LGPEKGYLLPWLVARLVVEYFDYVARPVASARRVARRAARCAARRRLLRLAQARRRLLRLAQAPRGLLRLRRASLCLGTSSGSSSGSSSTTSPTLRVRLLRLIVRLVACLIVDYFAYAARPGASARRGARHAARRRLLHLAQTHRRLLRLRRASGCFGTSCGSSRGSLSTISPLPRVRVPRLIARLVVDYFGYAARPSASERRTARRQLLHLLCSSGCFGSSRNLSRDSSSTTSPRAVARLIVDYFASRSRTTHRRLLRLVQARRRLLRIRRGSGCLGTSRGLSRGSSSTTPLRAGCSSTASTTTRVRLLRHVARLVAWLVVDYFASVARPGASARHAARCRLLRLRCASGSLGTSRGLSSTTSPTPRVRLLRLVVRLFA